jgi:hypothetical protein
LQMSPEEMCFLRSIIYLKIKKMNDCFAGVIYSACQFNL